MTKETLKRVIYARRFFILPFFGTFIVACFFSIKPLGENLYDLLNQEEMMSSQLAEKEKSLEQMGAPGFKTQGSRQSMNTLLQQVQQIANLNQLQVLSMSLGVKDKQSNLEHTDAQFILRVRLSGDFIGFVKFLSQLNQQGSPLLLKQLTFSLKKDILMIFLKAQVFPVVLGTHEKTGGRKKTRDLRHCRDPFHKEESSPARLQAILAEDKALKQFSLEDFRYIAYLAQGLKREALLLLPDGQVQEVVVGDIVGKKSWQVLSIKQNHLTLKAKNVKTIFTLKRD